jgi:nucleoside-diphosphate-sugar epimerase
MKKRILLTGGTGFIGKHLIDFLLEEGNEIICVKRSTSDTTNVDARVIWKEKKISEFIKSDFDNIDVLIHLASVGVSPKQASWEEAMQFNFIESNIFIELAIACDVKKIIVAGTFAEYGKTAESKLFLDIHDPLMPFGPYATSKAMLFYKLKDSSLQRISEISYLRLFSVYGEGQFQKNLWPALKNAAENGLDLDLTEGRQVRDFIHVTAVCKFFLNEINKENNKRFNVVNIGTGKGTSVKDFSNIWWKKFNATGKINFGALKSRPNEILRMVSNQNILDT